MGATREGGLKAAKKNLERDPDFYKRIGALGGSKTGIKKGFASMTPEKHKAASAKGGLVKGGKTRKVTPVEELKDLADKQVNPSKSTGLEKPKKRFALWGR